MTHMRRTSFFRFSENLNEDKNHRSAFSIAESFTFSFGDARKLSAKGERQTNFSGGQANCKGGSLSMKLAGFFLPVQIDKQRFGSGCRGSEKGRKVLNCRLGLMIRGRNVVLKLGSKKAQLPTTIAMHFHNFWSCLGVEKENFQLLLWQFFCISSRTRICKKLFLVSYLQICTKVCKLTELSFGDQNKNSDVSDKLSLSIDLPAFLMLNTNYFIENLFCSIPIQ